jgi:hypothetical protein
MSNGDEVNADAYLDNAKTWITCTINKANEIKKELHDNDAFTQIDASRKTLFTNVLTTIGDLKIDGAANGEGGDNAGHERNSEKIKHNGKEYTPVVINGFPYVKLEPDGWAGEHYNHAGEKVLGILHKEISSGLFFPIAHPGQQYKMLTESKDGTTLIETGENIQAPAQAQAGGNRRRSGSKKYNKKTIIRGGKKKRKRTRKQKRSKRV